MKDTRRTRLWTLVAAFAVAAAAGVASKRNLAKREARAPSFAAADEGLKDAVAAPLPATVSVAGRPVPTSYFKTPSQRRAEIDSALLARRRALARRVAVQ